MNKSRRIAAASAAALALATTAAAAGPAVAVVVAAPDGGGEPSSSSPRRAAPPAEGRFEKGREGGAHGRRSLRSPPDGDAPSPRDRRGLTWVGDFFTKYFGGSGGGNGGPAEAVPTPRPRPAPAPKKKASTTTRTPRPRPPRKTRAPRTQRPTRRPRTPATKRPTPPPTPNPTPSPTNEPITPFTSPLFPTGTTTTTTAATTTTAWVWSDGMEACYPDVSAGSCTCDTDPPPMIRSNPAVFLFPTLDYCCGAFACAGPWEWTPGMPACWPLVGAVPPECACGDDVPVMVQMMIDTDIGQRFVFETAGGCCEDWECDAADSTTPESTYIPTLHPTEFQLTNPGGGGGGTDFPPTDFPTYLVPVAEPPSDGPSYEPSSPFPTESPTDEPTVSPTEELARWFPDVGADSELCRLGTDYPPEYDDAQSTPLLFDSVHDCCEAYPEACPDADDASYWYPHAEADGERSCKYDADYPDTFYDNPVWRDNLLFGTRGECCVHYPEACPGNGNTSLGEKWWPDIDNADAELMRIECHFSDAYPDYMLFNQEVVDTHLFDDEAECCAEWNCDSFVMEFWYPYIDTSTMTVACQFGNDYPLYMEQEADDNLFETEDACEAMWVVQGVNPAPTTTTTTTTATTTTTTTTTTTPPPTPDPTPPPTPEPTPPPTSDPTPPPTPEPTPPAARWFPDVLQQVCRFGTDYPPEFATSQSDVFLFDSIHDCCEAYPDACPAPDAAAYWYPHMEADGDRTCRNDADYPDIFYVNPLWRDNFLFGTRAECCVTFPAACPGNGDTSLGEKWWPDIDNADQSTMTVECVFSDAYPDYMLINQEVVDTHLFDDEAECCAKWPCQAEVQAFWYPYVDVGETTIVCRFGNDYPLYMEQQADDHLFETEDACEAMWVVQGVNPAPIAATTTTTTTTTATTLPPWATEEFWFPEFAGTENRCIFGYGYDEFMTRPHYQDEYLFQQQEDCCAEHQCDDYVAPTDPPTPPPTNTPTPGPTEQPTKEPTPGPTEQPTKEPTPGLTEQPTKEPTPLPTKEPTDSPTKKPTSKPTNSPTARATGTSGRAIFAYPDMMNGNQNCLMDDLYPDFMAYPSNRDTHLFDTIEECCEAKGYPCTAEPTTMPSDGPTVSPTKEPTKEPTPAPTKEPTKQPTEEPTPAPTKKPTKMPTPAPTKKPTLSPNTILLPTNNPSPPPSPRPTRAPNPDPTFWYPDIHGEGNNCVFGSEFPAWMAADSHRDDFLHASHDECCDHHACDQGVSSNDAETPHRGDVVTFVNENFDTNPLDTLPWIHGGTTTHVADWHLTTHAKVSGTKSMRSGDLNHKRGKSSDVKLKVLTSRGAVVSFKYKADVSMPFDNFEFKLDGTLKHMDAIPSDGWSAFGLGVGPGEHEISFHLVSGTDNIGFERSVDPDFGTGVVYVDDLKVTPTR